METLIIIVAGFAAGFLNAIAGGGSFITLPALLLVGLNPIAANATGTVALLPGYIASAWRYRKDVINVNTPPLYLYLTVSILGGSLGAFIFLMADQKTFNAVIPWLMLFATLVFMFGTKLIKGLSVTKGNKAAITTGFIMIFFSCVYGGYFNGGLGIILLAALSLHGLDSIQTLNGFKTILSAVLTGIVSIIYFSSGIVNTQYVVPLGLASITGGYIGSAWSYNLSAKTIRTIIITISLIITLLFFIGQMFSWVSVETR